MANNSKVKYICLCMALLLMSHSSMAILIEKELPKITVWVDKPDNIYYIGEPIKISIKADMDTFIKVINIGSTGVVKQIFPLNKTDNNFIKAGEILEVPDDKLSYRIVVNGGEGNDLIEVIPADINGKTLMSYKKHIIIKKYIKKAILIANDLYGKEYNLHGPSKDAELIKEALKDKNFTEIKILKNRDKDEIYSEIKNLISDLDQGKVNEGLIYYSGHGANIQGSDYIMPPKNNPKEYLDLKNLINLSALLKDSKNLNIIYGAQQGAVANDGFDGSPLAQNISKAIKDHSELSSLEIYDISISKLKGEKGNGQIPAFYKNTEKNYRISKDLNSDNSSILFVIFDACRTDISSKLISK